jgi:hypothetical protein
MGMSVPRYSLHCTPRPSHRPRPEIMNRDYEDRVNEAAPIFPPFPVAPNAASTKGLTPARRDCDMWSAEDGEAKSETTRARRSDGSFSTPFHLG